MTAQVSRASRRPRCPLWGLGATQRAGSHGPETGLRDALGDSTERKATLSSAELQLRLAGRGPTSLSGTPHACVCGAPLQYVLPRMRSPLQIPEEGRLLLFYRKKQFDAHIGFVTCILLRSPGSALIPPHGPALGQRCPCLWPMRRGMVRRPRERDLCPRLPPGQAIKCWLLLSPGSVLHTALLSPGPSVGVPLTSLGLRC